MAAQLEADLAVLISQQESLFRRVQILYDLSVQISESPEKGKISVFRARQKDLPDIHDQFEEICHRISRKQLEIDPNKKPELARLSSFEELYYSVVAFGDELGEKLKPKHNPVSQVTQVEHKIPAKLPEVQIPTFNGDYKNWPTFYELFKSLIHENKSISNIVKFQYLYNVLSGPPHSLVKHLTITADNYNIAWSELVKQYEDPKILGVDYLETLLNFRPLTLGSVNNLNHFISMFVETVTSLQALKMKNLSEFILVQLGLRVLPFETRKLFETKFINKCDYPQFNDLANFIREEAKILSISSRNEVKSLIKPDRNSTQAPKLSFKNQRPLSPWSSKHNVSLSQNCPACHLPHSIYKCSSFQKMTPSQRKQFVKEKSFCFNCLKGSHLLDTCNSKTSCLSCGKRHHSLLCDKVNKNYPEASTSHVVSSKLDESLFSTSSNHVSLHSKNTSDSKFKTVLLGTAIVNIKSHDNSFIPCRALLDSCAQSTFLSSACAKKLGFSAKKNRFSISGIGQQDVFAEGVITCTITPRTSQEPQFCTEAVILPRITSNMPTVPLPKKLIDSYRHLVLADPTFDIPSEIDVLIGADLFHSIYDGQKFNVNDHSPTALHSVFGWVITGPVTMEIPSENLQTCSAVNTFLTSTQPLDQIIKRFWELEECPVSETSNPEHDLCEKIYSQHYRNENGRYVVPLLINPDCTYVPENSFDLAVSRLKSIERRLARHPAIKVDYTEFLNTYTQLGHMTRVNNATERKSVYFIPHHAVFKPDSSSTKVRVVFDGSSAPPNSVPLNKILLTGPKLQTDLVKILICWRLNLISFTADISKMYRNILIFPEHRHLQHILWRESPEQEIQEFELNTVTYGLSSSPYLALRTLRQLAEDEGDKFPLAAYILKHDVYIDDIISGASSVKEAVDISNELISLLQLGGFELRKWTSSSLEFLQHLPSEWHESPIDLDPDTGEVIKILGLIYFPQGDYFSYKSIKPHQTCTKRSILSHVARIYDPLGWLTPVTFRLKTLIQHLWRLGISFDDEVPISISNEWKIHCEQLVSLSTIQIPRYILSQQECTYRIIGFCDASERGYCALVYLHKSNPNHSQTSLVLAKSKVSPLKPITIPRLELCAALLLSKLLKYVSQTLSDRLEVKEILAFTDAATVLTWIKTPPYMLKTFVSTRVVQILENISPNAWHHIASSDNPADCGSRGMHPDQFVNNSSHWFNGPTFLCNPVISWPLLSFHPVKNVSELKSSATLNSFLETTSLEKNYIIHKFSSYRKLYYVLAWCLRFIENCRRCPTERKVGPLSRQELDHSIVSLVRLDQQEHFSKDFKHINNNKPCSQALARLNVYIDEVGTLRVGGRIKHADLPLDALHPWVLAKRSKLTSLLIDYYHLVYLHAGPRLLQSILSKRYWILSSRQIIRSRLSKCLTCFKFRAKPFNPQMGNLPKPRVISPGRPFKTVGIDMGGPFLIKESKRRNARITKCYLCLFVCFATKAVHLEVVSELSTDAFLAALDRFVSRRGLCEAIYTDCGSNFIGARRHINDMFLLLKQNYSTIYEVLTQKHIDWHFNPPSAPHFGGLWEAGIKSVKYHLKRVLKDQSFTFEGLSTIFSKVESILNSRPLCPLSSDPTELDVLTPGHFLIGGPLTSLPEAPIVDNKLSYLDRWRAQERTSQHFWQRWRNEYLNTLQQRAKWVHAKPNIKVDDLVILIEDNLPPARWSLGRIKKIHYGEDHIARVAEVLTARGTYLRPVVKLVPLPSN